MPLHQPILLQFKKNAKAATLTVQRADGTYTWTRLHKGMEIHDLAHYAVEQRLGLENAFFGLLSQGYDIGAFEAPKDVRLEALRPANLPRESLQVEHLVNLLLTEVQNGDELPDFIGQLNEILQLSALPTMPALTKETLGDIRRQITHLRTCWRATPENEQLELRLE